MLLPLPFIPTTPSLALHLLLFLTALSSDGTLTVQSAASIVSNNGDIMVTSFDVDLDGYTNSGSGITTLHTVANAQTIGLGSETGAMHLDNTELQHLSANGEPPP